MGWYLFATRSRAASDSLVADRACDVRRCRGCVDGWNGADTTRAILPSRGYGDRARGFLGDDDAGRRRRGGREHGDAQPLLRQPPGPADTRAAVRFTAGTWADGRGA